MALLSYVLNKHISVSFSQSSNNNETKTHTIQQHKTGHQSRASTNFTDYIIHSRYTKRQLSTAYFILQFFPLDNRTKKH